MGESGCLAHARCQNSGVEQRLFETGGAPPKRGQTRVPEAGRPLAVRMRPATLDELVGQQHLLGADSPLRRAIEDGRPHSMILYGPPGTGKTTIARLLAENASAAFEEISAVNAGRAEVREVLERADHRLAASGQPTIFFLDEIHRFNKAQQDALLPAVEEGLVILIGATTENPYFEVNSALLSRSQIYELRPLAHEQVAELLRRAITDPERGIANPPPGIDAGLGCGCVALLPRCDARGRRGPALHRAAHDRARLGGHRQRRPAGAAGRDRRRARRRARRHAGVRAQPEPGSRVPRAGAQIECQLYSTLAGPQRCARAGCGGAARVPPGRALPRRAQARARHGLRVPAQPGGRRVGSTPAAR